MKNLRVAVFLIGVFASGIPILAYATVVINELYYDHPGGDSGHEFIELYNNTDSAVDISNWQIQWGGTDFTYGDYIITAGTIYGFDYFLIGGSQTFSDFGVTPDLINDGFNFQNGGAETDGVRISGTGSYYDTVLYDSPNDNNLPATEGGWNDGKYAPDVDAGHSLERKNLGVDTNYASDWVDKSTPTPTPAVIPEPSTFLLFSSGLIGLAGILYRRKQRGR